MPRRPGTRAERREAIERLLMDDHDLSNREVARRCGSDHKTAGAVRRELERAGVIPARTLQPQAHGGALLAPEVGNVRALVSGVNSERRYLPLRDEWIAKLRTEFPDEDEDDVRIAAARRARMEMRERQLDRFGMTKRGEPAADDLTRLEALYEKQRVRFRANAKQRSGGSNESLSAVLAELTEGQAA